MDMPTKKFMSPHKLSQKYGIPENMIRADIKRGIAPGFYSGTWFHVDVAAYLESLSNRSKPEFEA
jgi:hypothetical protein